jgi:uncharacterized protein YndB with AHSA1/START domain
MAEGTRTIAIAAPVDTVFAFFTDPTNDPKWRPAVKEMTVQGAGPVGVGTQIHQVVKGPGGRGTPADLVVTDFESPAVYAFRVTAGPVRPVGQFRFSAKDGSTEVTFSLQAHLSGLKKLLMSRAVQSSIDAEMASLDTAKKLLESS